VDASLAFSLIGGKVMAKSYIVDLTRNMRNGEETYDNAMFTDLGDLLVALGEELKSKVVSSLALTIVVYREGE